jgi:hypothetical protein
MFLAVCRLGAVGVVIGGCIGTAILVSLAAKGTAFGLVGKAFSLKKILLPGGESERSSTIGTLDGFVFTHWMVLLSWKF